jgi:hypothetical protein
VDKGVDNVYKIFKNIDDKIKELGFKEVYKSDLLVQYERENKKFNYIHGVELIKKTGRIPIIKSYQKNTPDSKFDNMVGLNIKECKLFLKKIKRLRW